MALVIAGKCMVLGFHTDTDKNEKSFVNVFIIKVENELKRDEQGKTLPYITQTVQCLSEVGRIQNFRRSVFPKTIAMMGKEKNTWTFFSYELFDGKEIKKKKELPGSPRRKYFTFYDDIESVYDVGKKNDLRY